MKLAKTLRVLESDRELTVLLGTIHFLVAAAHSFFDIASTSLLIGHIGPDALPQVYLLGASLLIVVGLVIIPVVDRLERSTLFSIVLVVFAVLLLGSYRLAGLAPDFSYRGLYVACFLMKSLVFLQFWLLAGELLDLRQAKRLFPVLLGFSLVGGVFASLTASLLPRWLSTPSLLAVAGLLLLVSLAPVRVVARRLHRRVRSKPSRGPLFTQVWRGLEQDVAVSLRTPLLRTLSVFILLLALLAQVLDFLLGKAAHARFTSPLGIVNVDGLTTFYAVLNVIVVAAGIFVQLVFANRIISRVGVTRGQLLGPLAFVFGFGASGAAFFASAGALSSGFFFAIVGARAVQKVLRISVVRTSTDLVYNAIPSERRGRAKAFKETLIEPLGVLLSGLFLLASGRLSLGYILTGAFLLSALFLASTLELKSRYAESLVHVLKEKSRFRFAFPSLVMRKPPSREDALRVSSLRRALQNDEASVRLLAVEVASELKEPEAAELLVSRVRDEPDPEVRSRMMGALGKMIHQREQDAADEQSLGDQDPNVRASGIASLAQSGIYQPDDVYPEVSVEPKAPRTPMAPEPTTPSNPKPETRPSDDERRRLFLELARRRDHDALERLVHYLDEGDGATRHLAARALQSCGESAIPVLTLALWSTDVEGRSHVIRALDRIATAEARQALLPVLSLEAEEAYYDLVRLEAIRGLPKTSGTELLADSFAMRSLRARRNAHQVLRAVFLSEPGMRLILSNLNHPDRFVRASAIEALEMRVDSSLLGGILPLFEHESQRSIAELGSALFQLPVRSPLEVLEELTRHRSPWIRACAAYAMGQVGGITEVQTLERLLDDPYELTRWNAIEALGHVADGAALPLLEALAARGKSESDGKLREYAEAAIVEIASRRARVQQAD